MAHSARSLSVLIGFLVVVSMQGCASTEQPQWQIEQGMSRAEIEQKLGKPVQETPADGATLSTYDLVIDGNEMSAYVGHLGGCVGGCALAMMFIVPVAMVVDATGMFDEETELYVVYGKDDRAMFFGTGERGREDIAEFVQIYARAMQGEESAKIELDQILVEGRSIQGVRMHRKYLEAQRELQKKIAPIKSDAEAGNVDAQFQLGSYPGLRQEEKWVWLCRAANQGHASASYRVAEHFRYGHRPISQDYKKAYTWYVLSMRFGSPQIKTWSREEQDYIPALKALEKEMVPDEIVQARQSAADWKPSPSECEIERTKPPGS